MFAFPCPACQTMIEVGTDGTATTCNCHVCGLTVRIPLGGEVHAPLPSAETPETLPYQLPPRLQATVAYVAPEQQAKTDDAPLADTGSAALPRHAGRFRIVNEVARGGMGVVLRALDPELDRTLAVKIMLSGKEHPELEERFLEEARITGQLQHPGVPPVHELGRLEDGRAFFAMKLIEGRTLEDLLRARTDSTKELPRLVGMFEQLCQTIAYAHSRGILHRDLKPRNVMVGVFGEVQVMDWGLAKVVRSHAKGVNQEAEARVETLPASTQEATRHTVVWEPGNDDRKGEESSRTRVGMVLGTPAYMAPEQARGEIDQLDERCDVFGLGAILCRVLTGEPPFRGRHLSEVLDQAACAALTDAQERLQGCGADEELIALAVRCLAPTKEDRPRDATEVAHAVAVYRESVQERLKQAELARTEAQTRALEEQKRREIEQAKTRTERQKQRLTLALAGVLLILMLGGGIAGWWYLSEQARQAEEHAARKREEEKAQSELTARERYLNKSVLEALDEAARLRKELYNQVEDPLHVYALLSDLARWHTTLEAVRTAWQRARTMADSEPRLLQIEVADRLGELTRELQADETNYQLARKLDVIRQETATLVDGQWQFEKAGPKYAKVFQDAGYAVDRGGLQQEVAKIRQSRIRHVLVAALDHWAYTVRDDQTRAHLLAVATEADPDPWRNRFRKLEVSKDAGGLNQAAEDIELSRQSPHIIVALAAGLNSVKSDPVPLLRKALLQYPQDYWLLWKLGDTAKGPVERVGWFQAALAVRPQSGFAHGNLAYALLQNEDWEQAVRYYKKAIDINPSDAAALYNLGCAFRLKRDLKGAIKYYQLAVVADPTFAIAHNNLGNLLAETKEFKGAMVHFQKALALDPNYGNAHYNLGCTLKDMHDLEGAIQHFQKALAIDPTDLDACFNLGRAFYDKGDLDDAIREYQRAISMKPDFAQAHYCLASTLTDKNDLEGAIREYRKTITIDPSYPEAHCNLGLIYLDQGKFAQALKDLEKGHALGQKHPGWPYPSADWVKDCQRCMALDEKVTAILQDKRKLNDPAEALLLPPFCRRYKKHDPAAMKLAKDISDSLQAVNQWKGTLSPNQREQSYEVPLQAGKVYVIEMESKQLNSYLRLYDAGGTLLDENNDGGGFPNSRMVFKSREKGTYRILATSLGQEGRGSYIVNVWEFTGFKR